jgi:hypothetical protein
LQGANVGKNSPKSMKIRKTTEIKYFVLKAFQLLQGLNHHENKQYSNTQPG